MVFNRQFAISTLTANAADWKGKEAELANFSDEDLQLMVNCEMGVEAPEVAEEEEEEEEAPVVPAKKKKPPFVANSELPSFEDVLEYYPEQKAVYNSAKTIVESTKKALVTKLVANIADPAIKKAQSDIYEKLEVEQLKTLAKGLNTVKKPAPKAPTNNTQASTSFAEEVEEIVTNFAGAGGGPPVTNAVEDPTDVLLPTQPTDWKALVAAQRK